MKATPRRTATLSALAVILMLGIIPCALSQEARDSQELEEVLVKGDKPIRDSEVLQRWLPRLIGKFAISGTLHIHRPGDDAKLDAKGTADCIGVPGRELPTVHCELVVQWLTIAGRAATVSEVPVFQPAVVVFAHSRDFDRNPLIRHLLVDSEGKAESGAGVLVSADALVSRAKCLNVQGTCQRVVRITAPPDLRQVELEIGIATEQSTAHTMTLIMSRQQAAAAEQR